MTHRRAAISCSPTFPGLIEGAHEGVGLGDRFLGHVERCAVLLHLIDGNRRTIAKAYKTIRGELEAYGHGLDDKPEIVALNKVDAILTPTSRRKASALAKGARPASRCVDLRRLRRGRRRSRCARSPKRDQRRARAEAQCRRRRAKPGVGAVTSGLRQAPGGSSSRSARRCWSMAQAGAAAPRLAAALCATTSPRCAAQGADVHPGLVRRHRARAARAEAAASGTLRLEESQAAAAVGPDRAGAGLSKTVFRERGLIAAQILLTLGDTEERRRYLNARATIETLLKLGRGAGHQRERHGRDRGNPLRRQ